MLANLLIKLGWTRDDWKLVWLQVVAVASLITSNVIDLTYWLGYLGLPVSTTFVHWVMVLAIIILWIAGKYSTSPLPGAKT